MTKTTITKSNVYFQNKEYRGYLINEVQYFHLKDIVDLNDISEAFQGFDKKEVKFIDNRDESNFMLLNSIPKMFEYKGLTSEESVLVSWDGLIKRLSYIGK